MTIVIAEEPCHHLSSEGLREGAEDLGGGKWRLADGCVVRAMPAPPVCPACHGTGLDASGPACDCCSVDCAACGGNGRVWPETPHA